MKLRRRGLRLILVLTLALLGVGTGGFYFFSASSDTASAEDSSATETEQQAEATDAESTEGEAVDGENDENGEEGDEEDGETAVPVNVSQIATGAVSSYITATANLVAENQVMILAETEGRVEEVLVEEGDWVEKGQLLASLVSDDEAIAVKKAEITAANAKVDYERAARMAEQKLISQEALEEATSEYRLAEQELAEARWKLDRTEIRSPFAGRLTGRSITAGQHVMVRASNGSETGELFTVTDYDPLIARIYLPEKDVIGLNEGRDVRITLKADEDVTFNGRIRQISPVVDIATGTVKVTIEATKPPSQVRPGGFVAVNIIRETRPDVIVVPREAVIRELQKAHVFIANGEKAEKRAVSLGLEEGDNIEVISGIEAGQQIIVAGQGSLKDGSRIKVISDPSALETARDSSDLNHRARS